MKTLILLLGLLVFSSVSAKTLVAFKGGVMVSQNLSSLDSAKITGNSREILSLFTGGQGQNLSISEIDSIRFFDAVVDFTPEMLYNSFRADTMITDTGKTYVTLDLRNRAATTQGIIITDAIDVLDMANTGIPPALTLSMLHIVTACDTPAGSSIRLSYKSGDSYFSETGWSDWVSASSLSGKLPISGKRYIKLKFVFQTNSKSALPKITKVSLAANYSAVPTYVKPVWSPLYQNEKIVTGPFAFGFETRDNPTIKRFVTSYKIDSLVNTKSDEFAKDTAVLNWVAKRKNDRNDMGWNPYPWNLDSVFSRRDTIEGHCMSYALTLISMLTGVGQYARHWAIQAGGAPSDVGSVNSHEVVEVWSNKFKKWIYLDPSLDTWYANKTTNEPLSILEMHNIWARYLLHPGETFLMPASQQLTRLIDSLGGKCSPEIKAVDKFWHYGVFGTWNACQQHGYTTCAFMQMTERNNFHSQPTPVYPYFGASVRSYINTWHAWMDPYTPPYDGNINTTGRVRDFWYTLNQASIKAKRSGEAAVSLEFGQSQPFFKRFMVSIDGAAATEVSSTYTWTLHDGENTLVVTPEDDWGTQGISSTLKLMY